MRSFLLVSLAVLGLAWSAPALTLHVAPGGNDSWSGKLDAPNADRTDGPLATLAGARDALRRQRGTSQEPAEIILADGEYQISEPVIFEAGDSAITIQGSPDRRPLLTGGRKLSGFTVTPEGLWRLEIPEARNGQWPFEHLWVNGRRAILARTPNEDWFQAAGAATEPVPGVKLATPLDRTALVMRPEDIASLARLTPDELRETHALVYHSWNVSRHRLAGADLERGTLQFTGPARWAFFQMEPYHRVHLENYRAALDAPGEWFLDRQGVLLYQPRAGEDPRTAEVVAPVSPRWLEIHGAHALHFKNLRFAHTDYRLPPEGWTDAQADAALGAAIEATDAQDLRFENCDLSQTATYALWFRHGCRDSAIVHSHLYDLGAGGVKIGETTVPAKEEQQTKRITVENCFIEQGGRYFIGAVGILIGHSGENTIAHCEIADFYYSAISVGWVWGFKPSLAVQNRIEANNLHHLGWGVLSDLGAIYTLGPSAGTVIRLNRIHDIACYSYGGWGIYPDEGTSNALIEDNLVYRTESGGFHQHYGQENLVRNNIFADSREFQLRHSRVEDHLAFTFTGNIVVWKEGKLLGHLDKSWQGTQVALSKNLYWRADGQPFDFAGKTFAEWQASGQDAGSLIADPHFIHSEDGLYRLDLAHSPARDIGFHPFPIERAGLTGDDALAKLAKSRTYPPMDFSELKLEPTPLSFHEGFEQARVAERMGVFRVQTGGQPSSVQIVAESPSQGAKCLKLTDGPDLKPAYNPHLYCAPRHRHGYTKFSFDVRAEPALALVHEWRDAATPYHTGPALRIEKGTLQVGGKKLLDMPPPNEWLHIEIETTLGSDTATTWTLTATRPGQPPQRFENLPPIHPAFKTLEWLGFICAGTQPASVWLDELILTNKN